MEDRRTISLALGAQEQRQLLVESGTAILVASGEVRVEQSIDWINGVPIRVGQQLVCEDIWVAEGGGWVDIFAGTKAELVVIPPDRVSFWRQVGRRLDAWLNPSLGTGQESG